MNLSFSYSPFFLILIVLVAAALSWWMYRGTRDILPRAARIFLGVFRFGVLSAIAMLLLEPLLNSQTRTISPPIVAVLQDVSESMGISKDSAFAKREFPPLVKRFLAQFDPQTYAVDYYEFAGDLKQEANPDSLRYDQTGTNLSTALEDLQKLYQNQNLGAVVLISDGIGTAGVNPLFSIDRFRQPIYTVLMGDTTRQRDIKISEVLYNEIAYLKNEMPIRVQVQSEGFDKAELKVTLRGQGKVLDTKSLTLGRNRPQGEVDFLVIPSEPGVLQYEVLVTRMDDEISYRNNSRSLFVTVLETRVKIALFAGAPHPDLGALHEAFKREDRYEVIEFVHKNAGTFYTDPASFSLNDFDLFIFHNFPLTPSDQGWVGKIVQQIEDKNKPIIHIVGISTDLRTLAPLYKYMALAPNNLTPKAEEVIADFLPQYREHSTYTFPDNWIRWANNAPPIFRNRSNWEPKSTADVFATAKIKNIAVDYPVFALQNHLGRKNMVFLGENLWRLRAHAWLENEDFAYFDDWLFNNIKWLIVNDDKRKFKVAPSKRLYAGSEPVIFKGQTYDDSYNPISGVEIKLTLKSPDGKENVYYLKETNQSQYYQELYNLSEGTYSYFAEGKKNEVPVGTDKGQFAIGKSNIEHFQLQADKNVMQQLALRTGGEFTYARDLDAFAAKVKADNGLKPTISFKRNKRDFHQFWWILALLLGMLSVEWGVRKWYSML